MGDGRRRSTLPYGGGCTPKPFVSNVYSRFTVGIESGIYLSYTYNLSGKYTKVSV